MQIKMNDVLRYDVICSFFQRYADMDSLAEVRENAQALADRAASVSRLAFEKMIGRPTKPAAREK